MEEERTEEDKIIEVMIIEGEGAQYEDSDFVPSRGSLYDTLDAVPLYDTGVSSQIVWKRPSEYAKFPDYCREGGNFPMVTQGSLPDENFLGVLLGVASYTGTDLLANVIASRPGDFVKYGVFTARFYVEGEWVDVITDTRVPTVRNPSTGSYSPVYGRSSSPNDCWVTLVEKAYAKALGTYEAIPKVKIHDCLVHLTGGSVQMTAINDKYSQNSPAYRELWNKLKKALFNDTIVLAMPSREATGGAMPGDEKEDGASGTGAKVAHVTADEMEENKGIVPDRLYSIEAYREIGIIELVMLRDPWGLVPYEGEWNENSSKWDDYPDILESIYEDPNIHWRRESPKGYIWISYKEFTIFFKDIYFCKLFPDDKFNYYVSRGEWAGHMAGGPRHIVGHSREDVMAAARESELHAFQKATAAVVIDSDSSWFNNPQFILQAQKTTNVYISVSAVGDPAKLPLVSVDVVSVPRSSRANHLWDLTGSEHVALEEGECSILKGKGVESTIWQLKLDHRLKYYVVPHTARRGIPGQFVIRVFSHAPITMDEAQPVVETVASGEWKRQHETDTTGGPLVLNLHDGHKKDNPKWCQNPQYHLKVDDLESLDELHLKIVLRRKDKITQGTGGTIMHGTPGHGRSTNANQAPSAGGETKEAPNIGMVICKAETNEDPTKKINRKKTQKTNALGEVVEKKGSTLKYKSNVRRTEDGGVEIMKEEPVSSIPPPVVQRRLYVDDKTYHVQSSYSSKTEAVIYFPRVPRVWLPNGLIIVPSLQEPGVRGLFDIEVFSSDAVTLTPIPSTVSHSIAGEWTEGHCGGSHISPNWKKNPKYLLTLPPPDTDAALALPTPFQIKLSRNGTAWKKLVRTDAVGCMIGFYIFVLNSSGDMIPYYETTFAPSIEISTEPEFALQPLQMGESYVVMPTTFQENKHGSFILSFIADCEYTVLKEKPSHK